MFKKFFVASVLLNLIFVIAGGFYISKKGIPNIANTFGKPTPIIASAPYIDRVSVFANLPIDRQSVVFLGDSITAGNEWSELLKNANVKNRGIIGDTISASLTRLEPIVKENPKQIFMMYGTNDLQDQTDISTIVSNYKIAIENIKKNSKGSEVFIQSVLPINTEKFQLFNNKRTNKDILELNNQLQTLATNLKVTYIDLNSVFSKSGQLNASLTHDGLHLNGKGYNLWMSTIKHYINE